MDNFQLSISLIPSGLAGLISLFAAYRLFRRRSSAGAIPLGLMFSSIFIWCLSITAEALVPGLPQKLFWLRFQFLGISFVTVFWLLFCLRYANHSQPNTPAFFLIFSWIPLITILLAFTNQFHHLLWKEPWLTTINGQSVLIQDFGLWFWINTLYDHGLYLVGLFVLIQFYFKTPRTLRQQIWLIILAGLIPGMVNLYTLTGSNPFPRINLVALSFLFTGLIIIYVLYFRQFMYIVPIARDTTIENLQDGIIVLDLQDRIVDLNPAAEKILQTSLENALGKKIAEILAELSDWISNSKEGITPVKVINMGQDEAKKLYVINQIPLTDARQKMVGYTIIFHDSTETHLLNKHLKDQADRLSVLYEIGKAITSTLDINDLLELIYNQLSKVISSDAYFVALYLAETNEMDIKILYDRGKRYPGTQVDANEGISSWVVEHKKPLLIKDLREEMNNLGLKPVMVGEKRLSRSWLGVPMIADEQLIGLLAVTSYEPHMFDETDQILLEQISQQAVLSIQNARHYQEVTRQAKLDSLTGVSNHNNFIEILYEEQEKTIANLMPLSLIMLDIDHFKVYNDTYGHTIGDQVLRLTVQAIRSHIKKTDTVGRWGGEEFSILLPNATVTQANLVANRIRRTLSELPLFDVDGQTIPKPTISQGIATIPDHTTDANDLVVIADRALYRAKERGRDQVAVGKPTISS